MIQMKALILMDLSLYLEIGFSGLQPSLRSFSESGRRLADRSLDLGLLISSLSSPGRTREKTPCA